MRSTGIGKTGGGEFKLCGQIASPNEGAGLRYVVRSTGIA